jgi:hypothetical protein
MASKGSSSFSKGSQQDTKQGKIDERLSLINMSSLQILRENKEVTKFEKRKQPQNLKSCTETGDMYTS